MDAGLTLERRFRFLFCAQWECREFAMALRATLVILTAYFLLALAAASFAGEAGYFLARLPLWFSAYLTLFGVAYLLCGAILWLIIALAWELRANGKDAGLRSMSVRLRRDLLDGRLPRALYIGLLFCLVSTILLHTSH